MINSISQVDLQTTDFNNVTRDVLRALAMRHNVRGRGVLGTSYPPGNASKDELVRGFEQARSEGKFGNSAPTPSTNNASNVIVKTASVVVFLKGTGCHDREMYIAAFTDEDGKLVIASEYEPEDFEAGERPFDYERFTTSLADLKAFVAQIEANA